MRVIAVANQKGGCGKTTTSINFAACLASLGKNVLLVDLDPQGHSTCGVGIRAEQQEYTLYDLLSHLKGFKPPLSKVICAVEPRFQLIPSHEGLNALEEELANRPDREGRLGQELDQLSLLGYAFDYAVIDCPPNLGVLTFNALEAAHEVFIPVEPSFYSLHGLAKISETIQRVDQRRPEPLEVHALLTIFNSQISFAKEVYQEVKHHFKDRLFKTIIHECVLLREAAGSGQSIVNYSRDSEGYRDYHHLAVEYLEREWDRLLPPKTLGWEHVIQSRYSPRPVCGGILFQMQCQQARWVEIAGDFNGWIPEPLVRRNSSDVWQKVIRIHQGAFRYKYIVDGEWQVDPYQPTRLLNDYGGYDSYLEVGA